MDDLTKRRPQDAKRVNVNEQWELNWWTAHFRCSEAELRTAVRFVGVMVDDIAAFFRKHPPR